jgi:hypothetical protein
LPLSSATESPRRHPTAPLHDLPHAERRRTDLFAKASALDREEIIVKWRHAPYGTSEDQIQFSQQMQVTNGNIALPTTGRRLIKSPHGIDEDPVRIGGADEIRTRDLRSDRQEPRTADRSRPGNSGPAVPHLGLRQSMTDACSGNRLQILAKLAHEGRAGASGCSIGQSGASLIDEPESSSARRPAALRWTTRHLDCEK